MHIQAMLSKFYYYPFYMCVSMSGLISKYLPNGQHEYWESNYPRLQKAKAELDPKNVFSNPQSVQAL